MRTTILLLLAATFPQGAHAAVYSYVSQPITECPGECTDDPIFGFRYLETVVIDELLFPRGLLLNARIKSSESPRPGDWDYYDSGYRNVTITSVLGTYSEIIPFMNNYDGWSTAFMPVNTFLAGLIAPEGHLDFETDQYGSIISWDASGLFGGSNDYYLCGRPDNSCFDHDDAGYSTAGQGKWSGKSIYAPLEPVPVPAAFPLLTLALGSLGLAARRRRA